MIIDSHSHIGEFVKIVMPEKVLLDSMEKYNIRYTLCSNGSGVEVDHDQNLIPKNQQIKQFDVNERMLRFSRKNKDKIGAILWAKPLTEHCDEDFERQIKENLDIVHGIKVHPYHSKEAFNSEKTQQYFKLADKYNLTVVTHTANDYESSPELVYEMAKKYTSVNFVMYHMGLATDNQKAIELISKLPNLYGDTAWVKWEACLQAIQQCGSHKILFGTDNPINGLDTYNDDVFYNPYFHELPQQLKKNEYDDLMYKNAIKLFGLKIKK